MAWYIWIIIAILLSVAEILTPGFYFLCLGAAALVGVIPSLLGASITVQILTVAAAIVVVMVFLRPLMLRLTADKKTNTDRMIGKEVTLLKDSSPECKGEARIDGVIWPVTSNEPIKAGSKVIVERIDGITLAVREA